MSKANYFNEKGEKQKQIELPSQFSEEIRPDLIKRAVLAVQANKRQPYGSFKRAGQRQSAKLSRRRRKYKTAYDKGISRVPRKTTWRRGTQFGWTGAVAPGTVGGRKAHPPKAEKILKEKINKKERKKAIRSALSATIIPEIVKTRGHKFKELPTIINSGIEKLNKTKQVKQLLIKLGLEKELKRTEKRKVRAGKGTKRGRKHKTKTGPLIIVSKNCPLSKSAINIQGLQVSAIKNINAELLAPGTIPGRLTIYTEDAIKLLEKEKLFT